MKNLSTSGVGLHSELLHGTSSVEVGRELQRVRSRVSPGSRSLQVMVDGAHTMPRTNGAWPAPVSFSDDATFAVRKLSARLNVSTEAILIGVLSLLMSRLVGAEGLVIERANWDAPAHGAGDDSSQYKQRVQLSLHDDCEVSAFLRQVDALASGVVLRQNQTSETRSETEIAKDGAYAKGSLTLYSVPLEQTFPLTQQSRVNGPEQTCMWAALRGTQVALLASCSFDANAIKSAAEYLERVALWITNHPSNTVSRIRILTDDERNQVVEAFNDTAIPYPCDELISEVFEKQVFESPTELAVESNGNRLTYSELNEKANKLARYLTKREVGPDVLVGLFLDRSIEMMIGILATLKAGGAYLPLDPDYPAERIALMLQDAAPRVVLTKAYLRERLPAATMEIVELDTKRASIESYNGGNLDRRESGLCSKNLAYVIYTSGTTGKPKGVMIEHRNVLSLWQGLESIYRKAAGCRRIAVNASFTFDASVKQIFQLLSSRTIVLVPQQDRWDPWGLTNFVRKQRIDAIDCTPSQLKQWLTAGLLEGKEHRPRLILVGGEPIDAELWRRLATFEGTHFCNVYGPTESTVDTTYAFLTGDLAAPHIGRPMENRCVYMLDRSDEPVPVGVAGEIHVGGAGVARGYLNRPEFTAERFIADPFAVHACARLYRTGDVGRWRPDGTIEYLGRIDQQVKIRGYRVEPEDVESQLLQNSLVKEAAVVARESPGGDKRLVAYVVPDPANLDTGAKRDFDEASAQMLKQWNKVHDVTYSAASIAPSFVGWNSSYTGQPIPQAEMEEWLACTVERIRALRPRRVVEIGCGVGLLLQHIAPETEKYVGVDFSDPALQRLRRWLADRQGAGNVELLHRAGTDLHDLPAGSCDTVILNSVVQYFPDVEYLLAVLGQAIRLLGPEGKIFIGDIRHCGSLPMFHSNVQLSKAPDTMTLGQLKARVVRALEQEKELVIDPSFFDLLPGKLENIGAAHVQIKRGRASNELTRYRYDVVLEKVGQASLGNAGGYDWHSSIDSIDSIEVMLRERRVPFLQLREITNSRVAIEAITHELIHKSDDWQTVGELRKRIKERTPEGVDPEDLWHLGQVLGYSVSVRWSSAPSLHCFDVRFIDECSLPDRAASVSGSAPTKPLSAYANNPLENSARQLVVPKLREYLKSRLPDYMLPSSWIILRQMPLTPSGKLDRRALPAPQGRPESMGDYVAPRTDLECMLAEIWAQLLGVEEVGIDDNFFELGGHSLLVMQLMDRLRRIGFYAEALRVFENPTVVGLAAVLTRTMSEHLDVAPNLIPTDSPVITPEMLPLIELQSIHIESIVQSVPGGAKNVQDIYPLAPLQEGILFHHLLNDHGMDTYVISTVLSIDSPERVQRFTQALQAVVDRHDILRTAVLWEKLPRPLQVVYRRVRLAVEALELEEGRDPLEQIKELLTLDREGLDLRAAPLMRLRLAADARTGISYILLQQHHITSDHVTLDVIISEVVAHMESDSCTLPEPVAYRNHVAQALSYARTKDAEEYFRRKLGDITEPTAPFGLVDVHTTGTELGETSEELNSDVTYRVRACARKFGVSSAVIFHAAWSLVVAITSGRDDVVFGSVMLGRLHGSAGAQRTLGMFINTLPWRSKIGDVTVRELIEQTQQELIGLLNHEQASLAVAQRCSGIDGSMPLFTALLNYAHSEAMPEIHWSKARGLRMLLRQERTNYPVTLSVDDLGSRFILTAQTDSRIDPARITRFTTAALVSLVEALAFAPETKASSLSVMPDRERQLINSFNGRRVTDPTIRLVHDLFHEQARCTPHETAIVCGTRMLTYAELDETSNVVAAQLRRRGVGPDKLVGLCIERSVEMIVGMLGILKAGGGYLPLDPHYPLERRQYMIRDAAPSIVLTKADVESLICDALGEDDHALQGSADRPLGLMPSSLIYVIYTSGSTGQPKGIAMPHRSMVNLIEWHRREFHDGQGLRVLQFAALGFDVAFQEIFTTLCTGATLVMIDEWVRRDASALLDFLQIKNVNRLFLPPLMLESIAQASMAARLVPSALRDVIAAGEQLHVSPTIRAFFARVSGCRLHNHYGPTETHVVTALTLSGDPMEWSALPTIGSPIDNSQIYILNETLRPVPIGVVGEVYIGGAGVARAYLNRPELTAERFIPNPLFDGIGERVYRTGDLGRWRNDGSIEYLGRNDTQVKIRGFRVELGEIEAQLLAHSQVHEAAVIVRDDIAGHRQLVAYVSPRTREELSIEQLQGHLKEVLPGHMVPTTFYVLSKLPLTPNGKLDRRALPAPEQVSQIIDDVDMPQGAIEQILADIWQDVLGVTAVGRDENFFDLGGHSLLAMQVAVRIHSLLLTVVSVRTLFECPTISELAMALERQLVNATENQHGTLDDFLEKVESLSESAVRELLKEVGA